MHVEAVKGCTGHIWGTPAFFWQLEARWGEVNCSLNSS